MPRRRGRATASGRRSNPSMRYGHISERLIAKAEVELGKYGYHWALASRGPARVRARPRSGVQRVAVPAEVKASYRRGDLKPGDLVEGTALLSPFVSIYKPRAYYPEYLLGQMKLEPARPGEGIPASPRIRPAVKLPPLPEGTGLAFLYPPGKGALERLAFPGDLREALTRDYEQVPLVLPPESEAWTGPCEFRARLQRLSASDALKLGGVAGPLYGTLEERGLTLFLSAQDNGCSVERLSTEGHAPFAGSLYLEARVTGERADAHLRDALAEELPAAVEKHFGGVEAAQRTQVMSRLLALVQPPVIVIQRAPHLLSLFMPCDLADDLPGCASDFEGFAKALFAGLRRNIEGHGHDLDVVIDFAYDCRRPFFAERRAMRTDLVDEVLRRRPYLVPVRDWLTGTLA